MLFHPKLTASIQYVKNVGPKVARYLAKLGINTVSDFLYFLPKDHADRKVLPKLSELKEGETVFTLVKIKYFNQEKKQDTYLTKALAFDSSSSLNMVWFNQPYVTNIIKPGQLVLIGGKVEYNPFIQDIELNVQEYIVLENKQDYFKHAGRLIPLYTLTKGLSQRKMRDIYTEITQHFFKYIEEPLPHNIRSKINLLDLKSALKNLHYPQDLPTYQQARKRIVFDEFFYLQLSLLSRKQLIATSVKGLKLITDGSHHKAYLQSLPYQLTAAQLNSIKEIQQDVLSGQAMNRIIQGDVGCGKTDVAIIALLMAIESGFNAVLMAPTEILAQQHYLRLKKYISPLNIKILLLKGKLPTAVKKQALAQIKNPGPQIIVGTHALIQDKISIPKLALAIIDEQHKFGVVQRLRLKKKNYAPHCLFMTATPIPRSLMLTCFGDLDKTIINELPPGRIRPTTYFMRLKNIAKIYEFCQIQLKKGGQVYIVYPLIEESAKLDLQAATESFIYLQKHVFSDFAVGLVHGKMPIKEKEKMMDGFKQNKLQVLVSTTVIEVGIDVPNANTMVIQHAERFGLSQLHQLRGRIGRNGQQSTCFLVADPKSASAKKRIAAMLETADGFKIAELDLNIRGPGDRLGVRQSGVSDLKYADLVQDEPILLAARAAASYILKKDPTLSSPEHAKIKEILIKKHKMLFNETLN
ncbi:ATP-dependent DNA helicase RecG [bacterium]|nr:ATP-dependent DNA helicase RecG [bacterium]MBT3580854.1 ATP-dependent DNA helicase RecG [bacterium]MBT4552420.1 ATP-dependent DNA helicase RecG [bacterium]MBT5989090.1 ATP-dependent DNA helicase RecG [bacterium]MBT7088041.1 ATP-dependent DNA helicase RecG [bacterium]